MPKHSWWNQVLQESQQIPGVVHLTAFLQYPQGYLQGLGPGLGSGA